MKTGIELIAEERQEQITKHGRTIELDVFKNKGMQLSDAAAILASPTISSPRKRLSVMPSDWDDFISLKMCSKTYYERLIIAGSLISAEIDRISQDY